MNFVLLLKDSWKEDTVECIRVGFEAEIYNDGKKSFRIKDQYDWCLVQIHFYLHQEKSTMRLEYF